MADGNATFTATPSGIKLLDWAKVIRTGIPANCYKGRMEKASNSVGNGEGRIKLQDCLAVPEMHADFVEKGFLCLVV
jgi:hypothetical protein